MGKLEGAFSANVAQGLEGRPTKTVVEMPCRRRASKSQRFNLAAVDRYESSDGIISILQKLTRDHLEGDPSFCQLDAAPRAFLKEANAEHLLESLSLHTQVRFTGVKVLSSRSKPFVIGYCQEVGEMAEFDPIVHAVSPIAEKFLAPACRTGVQLIVLTTFR